MSDSNGGDEAGRGVLARAKQAIQADTRAEKAIPELLASVQRLESETQDLRVEAKLTTIRLCIERLHAAPAGCDEQLREIALTAISHLLRAPSGSMNQ